MYQLISELEKSEDKRKKAEDILKESEAILRTLINATRETLIMIDTEDRVLLANEVVAQRLGKSSQELIGTCLYDHFPPDIAKSRKEHFDKVAITGESIRFEDTRAGRFYEIYCYPVFNEEGKVSRLVIFARDITDRKEAEDMVRESEEKYRSIFENSIMGIFRTTPDGHYLSANPAGAKMYGYKSQEEMIQSVTGMAHQIYVHPEDRKRFKELIESSGFAEGFEAEHYTKDGSKIWASMNARIIRDTSGAILYYETTSQNITKRKRAEDALRQSEEKYRSIFKNSVEGIFQTTPEGQYISVNPALARMIGYDSPEELKKGVTNLSKQGYVNPEDRVRYKKILEEQGIIQGFEIQHYRKDGSIFWVSINSRAVKDATGKVLYYEGAVEDITSRKQAEEELKQTLEKLRKTLAGTIQAMSLTVETRDPYTSGHQKRVSNLARVIAQEMALPKDEVDNVRMAGIIHDIGKMSVPAEILSKPTKLSNMEFGLIKVHPQTGYDILKEVELPYPIAETVLQHHERLDGSGYPQGLKGENIILEARILAVADVVEAMASYRPYRPALGIDAALEEIEKNKGILYDAEVVEVCLKLFREKGFRF
jgi:PAS domain S-box-containing protein/putative nucleotidyltransferase with HDIG domain